MTEASAIITAIIGLVAGVVGALIAGAFQRRKVVAEAQKLHAEATGAEADANEKIRLTVMSLIDPLNEKIEKLEKRVATLECRATQYLKRIAYLMDGILKLIRQIEDAKMAPCWRPDEWQPEEDK